MIERLEFIPLTGQIHEIYRKQKDQGENGRASAETYASTLPRAIYPAMDRSRLEILTDVPDNYVQSLIRVCCNSLLWISSALPIRIQT